jgi:hypothetical protein
MCCGPSSRRELPFRLLVPATISCKAGDTSQGFRAPAAVACNSCPGVTLTRAMMAVVTKQQHQGLDSRFRSKWSVCPFCSPLALSSLMWSQDDTPRVAHAPLETCCVGLSFPCTEVRIEESCWVAMSRLRTSRARSGSTRGEPKRLFLDTWVRHAICCTSLGWCLEPKGQAAGSITQVLTCYSNTRCHNRSAALPARPHALCQAAGGLGQFSCMAAQSAKQVISHHTADIGIRQ